MPLPSRQSVLVNLDPSEESAAIGAAQSLYRQQRCPTRKLVVALDKGYHISLAVHGRSDTVVSFPTGISPAVASAVGSVCVNQLGPLRCPLFRKKRRNGQFLFPRGRHVFRKIRVRQLFCLDHGVQGFGRPKPHPSAPVDVSMIFSISNAARPCTLGGNS